MRERTAGWQTNIYVSTIPRTFNIMAEGDDDEISEGEDMDNEWSNDDESDDNNNMPYVDYLDESNEDEDSDNDSMGRRGKCGHGRRRTVTMTAWTGVTTADRGGQGREREAHQ